MGMTRGWAARLVRARRLAAHRGLAAGVAVVRGGVQGRRLVQLLLLRLHADVLVCLLVHLLVRGVVHPAADVQARATHLQIASAAKRQQTGGDNAAKSLAAVNEDYPRTASLTKGNSQKAVFMGAAPSVIPTGAGHD